MSLLRAAFLFLTLVLSAGAFGQKPDASDYSRIRSKLASIDPASKPDSALAAFYLASGKLYDSGYKYDTATLLLIKARDSFRLLTPEGSFGEAQACHALGDVYKYELYDFDQAEVQYERALALQVQLNPSDIRNLTRLHYNLATTNRSQSDLETSVTWCMKAVSGAESMKDNVFLERTYQILGNIYRDMHEYDSAGVYYQKGVDVNQSINKGKPNETLFGLLGGWGDAFYRQGNLQQAATALTSAVSIYEKIGTPDKTIYLHHVRLLAEVQMKMNKKAKAFEYLKAIDKIRNELDLERGGPASSVYHSFGNYYRQFGKDDGDNHKALDYYHRALAATTGSHSMIDRLSNPLIEDVELKAFAYDGLLGKAEMLMKMSVANVDEKERKELALHAVQCYELADRVMVKSRSELETEDAKWNYVDANYQLFESALDALNKLNRSDFFDHDLVLRFFESSKSKSIADALREVEMKRHLGKSDTLLNQLRTLRQRSLTLQHDIDRKNDLAARDQLIVNSNRMSSIEALIDQRYPSYLKIKNETTFVSLSALQNKVRLLDATFIEYFWGANHVYAYVVTPDSSVGPGFYDLGNVGNVQASLATLVSIFREKSNRYTPDAVLGFASVANDAYRILLQPFEARFKGRKRLVIVPDGPLMQVPFETLVTSLSPGQSYKNLPYLVNDYIISYGFSGYYFAGKQRDPATNPRLLAFGFTGGNNTRSADNQSVEIAGTETELLTLSEKFPDGRFLFGDSVTERAFKTTASSYDLLHIAVHGSGDTGEDYSATLHFRDKNGSEDGHLYWYELYNMNLRASLAVLSSCESGIGKTYRGEGMLSMANAFTFAGCSNIVMGLWKVDDQVSVKLMDTFYSELLNGMSIDEALALAKRTYLASADQVSANPKLWGSLVAYGEAPVVKPDEIHFGWAVLALVVLVVAITILYRTTRKK